MKPGMLAAVILLPTCFAQGQVTITSADMFNTVGQYYRVYGNTDGSSVDITGRLGNSGGPQTWDFTSGPTNLVYRFDYVATDDGGKAADFPLAAFAERQSNEGNGTKMAWLYLKQVTGSGRLNYGFYSPSTTSSFTEGQFNPPIRDFPDPITYQKTWDLTTSYSGDVLGISMTDDYTASATVDAYGTIILPNLGSLNCLRINELDAHAVSYLDPESGAQTPFETDYVRVYYFVSPGHGIVATINSAQTTAVPDNNFNSAAQFVRMFDLKRDTSVHNGPGPVTDLTLTMAGTVASLNWSKTTNTVSYQVEVSTNLLGTNAWQVLTTTTKNYYLDTATSNAQQRYYRIVSLAQ